MNSKSGRPDLYAGYVQDRTYISSLCSSTSGYSVNCNFINNNGTFFVKIQADTTLIDEKLVISAEKEMEIKEEKYRSNVPVDLNVYVPLCPECPQCDAYSLEACILATFSNGLQLSTKNSTGN